MLPSLNSLEDDEYTVHDSLQHPSSMSFASFAGNRMHKLLINCAELMSQSNFHAARRLLCFLSSISSAYGDSTERLVYQFTKALCQRLGGNGSFHSFSVKELQSSYLSFNQITPFLRFSHLTANQAILEAIQGQNNIHILDFDIMQGVQWPPLMQAIVERSDPSNSNPPFLRITGAGQNLDTLHKTGNRLYKFAEFLGLRFEFTPLHFPGDPSSSFHHLPLSLPVIDGEALAVNCMFYTHRFVRENLKELMLFLRSIKSLNPKVLTLAEREANINCSNFTKRFKEALNHYSLLFDSLEATVSPKNPERLALEQVWFGREISDIVAMEGEERKERDEKSERWSEILKSCGFSQVPFSHFALSQAQLLLRLHYPCERYKLRSYKDSFLLGWGEHAILSVSSWN